jgi:S-adenosylmethionine-diacylglycerol 3-amino-3-carboxypropyl transferase
MRSDSMALDSEAAAKTYFSARIRYAQAWEDADVLLAALDIRPGDVCLSISSGGDNALSMLAYQPRRVIALDLNPTQLACLELKVAAYRVLQHSELLELIGSKASDQRDRLYLRCRPLISEETRRFWDGHSREIRNGIGTAGKFERYLTVFRNWILPLVHPARRCEELLLAKPRQERSDFYDRRWDTWRWRLLGRICFSRFALGSLGFFRYAEEPVAPWLLERARHAFVELDPADNPYLQWILTGRHATALPFSLRRENFEKIRDNLDRVEWHCRSADDYLSGAAAGSIDRFNMSDIFEYMTPETYAALLERLIKAGKSGGRIAYWNAFVDRQRPARLQDQLRPLDELARQLEVGEKAFFYRRFVVEEIV